MDAEAVLQRLRSKGVILEAQGDRLRYCPQDAVTAEDVEVMRQHKAELRRLLIIEAAYAMADKVNDALGITDPLTREINRISWAVQDLQDAEEPEAVWGPLLEEEHRLHRQWEARREV